MHVAVTGAGGHLGRNVLAALQAAGHTTRAIVRAGSTRAGRPPQADEILAADLRDPASLAGALAGIDAVIHLAAVVSVESGGYDDLVAINTAGTARVIAACRAQAVRRLVHFSSIEAFDPHPRHAPLDESRPLADWPLNRPYARSKAEAERLVREAATLGDPEIVILNPTSCLGPHDHGPSHGGQALLMMAAGRMPALLRAGFDWVDTRDVASGAVAALTAPAGNRYLLGGRWADLRELATHVAELRGGGRVPPVLPLWTAWLGLPFAQAFSAMTGRRPVFTPVSLKVVAESPLDVRSDAARHDLGHNPRPLRQTIADSLAWFAREGMLVLPESAPAWQEARLDP